MVRVKAPLYTLTMSFSRCSGFIFIAFSHPRLFLSFFFPLLLLWYFLPNLGFTSSSLVDNTAHFVSFISSLFFRQYNLIIPFQRRSFPYVPPIRNTFHRPDLNHDPHIQQRTRTSTSPGQSTRRA